MAGHGLGDPLGPRESRDAPSGSRPLAAPHGGELRSDRGHRRVRLTKEDGRFLRQNCMAELQHGADARTGIGEDGVACMG